MREAMKKAIILIVLAIAIPVCLFAETSELSRKKVVLTAFKDLNTSSVPAEINYLKFYAQQQKEISLPKFKTEEVLH